MPDVDGFTRRPVDPAPDVEPSREEQLMERVFQLEERNAGARDRTIQLRDKLHLVAAKLRLEETKVQELEALLAAETEHSRIYIEGLKDGVQWVLSCR